MTCARGVETNWGGGIIYKSSDQGRARESEVGEVPNILVHGPRAGFGERKINHISNRMLKSCSRTQKL